MCDLLDCQLSPCNRSRGTEQQNACFYRCSGSTFLLSHSSIDGAHITDSYSQFKFSNRLGAKHYYIIILMHAVFAPRRKVRFWVGQATACVPCEITYKSDESVESVCFNVCTCTCVLCWYACPHTRDRVESKFSSLSSGYCLHVWFLCAPGHIQLCVCACSFISVPFIRRPSVFTGVSFLSLTAIAVVSHHCRLRRCAVDVVAQTVRFECIVICWFFITLLHTVDRACRPVGRSVRCYNCTQLWE